MSFLVVAMFVQLAVLALLGLTRRGHAPVLIENILLYGTAFAPPVLIAAALLTSRLPFGNLIGLVAMVGLTVSGAVGVAVALTLGGDGREGI